ncbi:DUF2637 domain-containing protein [Nocardia testacea]|uniref:DUF2637 domain-containing protein n=1 Tax=Nocardia testacea TaxID=248551 RepID=UPI003A847703
MFTPARIALTGAVALTALSFILSFTALTDLADRSGISHPVLWPLIVDGLGIVATVAVVALRNSRYAWFLLGTATVISIIGNVVHALLPAGPVAPEVAAAVAVVPPVAMIAVIHLAVILASHAAARQETAPVVDLTAAPTPEAQPQPAEPAPAIEAPASVTVAELPAAPETITSAVIPAPAAAVRVQAPSEARAEAEALIADQPHLSNYAIASRVGVSEATVRRWRKQLIAA